MPASRRRETLTAAARLDGWFTVRDVLCVDSTLKPLAVRSHLHMFRHEGLLDMRSRRPGSHEPDRYHWKD